MKAVAVMLAAAAALALTGCTGLYFGQGDYSPRQMRQPQTVRTATVVRVSASVTHPKERSGSSRTPRAISGGSQAPP